MNTIDKKSIKEFVLHRGVYFSEEQFPIIYQKLEKVSEENFSTLLCTKFKNPDISLILSILFGILGVDRFYIGNTGLGVAKLLTRGGFIIWWIIDIFIIQKATKKKNLQKLEKTIDFLEGETYSKTEENKLNNSWREHKKDYT